MKIILTILLTIWTVILVPLEVLSFLYVGRYILPKLAPTSLEPLHIFSWILGWLSLIIPVVIIFTILIHKNRSRRRGRKQ